MNNPLDPTLRELNDCGCCAGTAAETPLAIENRPGLPAIDFRAGKHPQFKASLLAALTTSGNPALRNLKTRDDDDFTIALLDGWATVADVLSFYSERIANESFLRTATERRSILELARTIGYELNPGVAASTWLTFLVEAAEGAPGYANIDKGTKVQSIPGPDEKPQTFETIEPFVARKEWNELRPQAHKAPVPTHRMRELRLKGTETGLKPGDALLVVGNEREKDPGNDNWDFRRVSKVEPFPDPAPEKSYTRVTLDRGLGSERPWKDPARDNAKVFALRTRANFFGQNAPDWRAMPKSIKEAFDPGGKNPDWPGFTLSDVSNGPIGTDQGSGLYGEYFDSRNHVDRKFGRTDKQIDFSHWGQVPPHPVLGKTEFSVRWTGWIQARATGAHTFTTVSDDGVRLWVNGDLIIDNWTTHGAASNTSKALPLEKGKSYELKLEFFQGPGLAVIQLFWAYPGQTQELVPKSQLYPGDINVVHLDAVYPVIVPGGWLVVSTTKYDEVFQVVTAIEDARTNFTLTAKTTRLTVRGENLREKFNNQIREASIFAESVELPWAPEPIYDALFGEEITLDQTVLELPADRALFVTGKPARVRVTDDGASLELTLADGKRRPLNIGAMLSLVGPPVAQLDRPGVSRWDLRMEDGTAGFLFAGAAELKFVAAAEGDAPISEAVSLKRTEKASDGSSRLVLTQPLKYAYDPTTTVIYGNAAFATHGETTEEVLGSGNANQPHQRFVLKHTPLTYTPAANASGGESTLQIWVNDVKWREVPTLFNLGPRDRVYVVRLADDGKATVLFGDGKSGARLPTGHENVRAVYRKGIGHEGLLKPDKLTLLLTRPLGAKSVTNPKATERAVDPQVFADARQNAPTTVLTLDRVVSLEDYEDFARNFSGVAKALATWTWNVNSRGIFLTVAGLAGVSIAPDSSIRSDLLRSLRDLGNPLLPAEIKSYKPVKFRLAGTVFVDADRLPEKVETAVKDALKAGFSFEARSFGQPVALSEVEAVIQNVPGVAFVDLDALYIGSSHVLEHYLAAQKPEEGAAIGTVSPAELLTLDETFLSDLKVKTV
jgi:PA14 domain